MNSVISTAHLTKKFVSSEAVHDLNLEVPEASIFGYIGPNGAGKTTTIKTLMNIFVPSSGSGTVLGLDSRRLSPARLQQIGYVSENQEMPGWMSVDYLLDYCRAFYPNWDPALCDSLVKQFDLLRKQKLKQLSRGMRMKAALVSAIAYRPQLLVLDEPFSGLDKRDLLNAGVIVHTYNPHIGSFLPSLGSSTNQSLLSGRGGRHCYEIMWFQWTAYLGSRRNRHTSVQLSQTWSET